MLKSRAGVVLDAIRTLFGISGLLKRTAAIYGDDDRPWPRTNDQTVSRIFVTWSTQVSSVNIGSATAAPYVTTSIASCPSCLRFSSGRISCAQPTADR